VVFDPAAYRDQATVKRFNEAASAKTRNRTTPRRA